MSAAANDTVALLPRGRYSRIRLDVSFSITRFQAMAFSVAAPSRSWSIGFILLFGLIFFSAPWPQASAQKLVDPNTVAPEYRALAEKRRAEQIKQFECSKKADEAKVPRRDRVSFINECIDK
jgi:hypothetical protein